MTAAKRIDQIRAQLEKLRKDSLDTVVAANRIVYQGVQRVADHELKALNDTYRAALSSLKQVKRSDSLKGVTGKQIDVLQNAANRIIASAREALEIVAETRQELTKMMQKNIKGGKVSSAEIEQTTKRARKAVTEVRDSASKAAKNSRESAKKVAKNAKKKTGGTVKTARKAVKKAAKKTVKSAPKKARSTVRRSKAVAAESTSTLVPSPNSRASRATSRAKKAATRISSTATDAVETAMQQPVES